MKLLGNIADKTKMAHLYSLADATLLTSKRETFSMVCAESLCCGTPVIGFKAGAPEMISIPAYSAFCDYGDLDSLENILNNCLHKEKPSTISADSASVYKREKMIKEYIHLYQTLVN